jgi:hypothetical protein
LRSDWAGEKDVIYFGIIWSIRGAMMRGEATCWVRKLFSRRQRESKTFTRVGAGGPVLVRVGRVVWAGMSVV